MGYISDMREAVKVADLLGFDRFIERDGEFTIYKTFDFDAIGTVYVGLYLRESNIQVARYENGGASWRGVFYSGYLDYHYDESDEESDEIVYDWFDILEFAKQKIKDYFSNI